MLRFWNNEVLGETEAVLERIFQEIAPSPQPLSHEGRGAKTLERVRWRCRRGLLELDIVLGRFIEQRYATMGDQQRAAFDELLDLPDTELWDAVTGKKEPPHAHQHEVVQWLKEV